MSVAEPQLDPLKEPLEDVKRLLDEYHLTTQDVAPALGVTNQAVYNMAQDGRLPHLRVGNGPKAKIRFRAEDIRAFVEIRA